MSQNQSNTFESVTKVNLFNVCICDNSVFIFQKVELKNLNSSKTFYPNKSFTILKYLR